MSYEIKPLGVGGILDQAVKLLKNHFGLFLGISMCVSVPFGLVMSFVMLGITPQLSESPTPQEIEALQQGLASNFAIIIGMSFVSMIIVYPLTTGAMIHAVASEYLGKPTTIGASIGRALRVFFPLLLTSFMMFVAIYVGFLFCIIPGFYFLVRYSLSSHAVVLDELSGSAALKRSSSLMLHDRSKNYNTLVLLWLLLGVIGFAINMASSFVPQQHVAIVVGVLLQAVNGAFGAAAFAVFYFSCRCKAENFDLELLADAMHVETATPESPIAPQ